MMIYLYVHEFSDHRHEERMMRMKTKEKDKKISNANYLLYQFYI